MDAVTLAMIKGLGNGGSSLPAVTSSDNGKVLAVKDGAWAADSNLLLVTITYANFNYSSDKTYEEIFAAIEAGRTVVAKYTKEYYFVIYADSSNTLGKIEFGRINSDGSFISYVKVDKYNNVTKFNKSCLLPTVSSSNNGSELIVKNGSWAAQQKKFIVTLTPTSPDFSGTMDKTPAEITAAYGAGQEIVFDIPSMSARIHATQFLVVNDVIIAGGMVFYDVNNSPVIITIATDSSASTYATQVFATTPAS